MDERAKYKWITNVIQQREAAQQQLTKIGREVVPLLDNFLETNDLEIKVRILQIKDALK